MIKITSVQSKHTAQIAQLSAQLGYPTTTSNAAKHLRSLKRLKHHHVVVAQNGGIAVGWMHLEIVTGMLSEPRVEIQAVVVNESNRGQGIGKALMNYAKAWTKKKKVKMLYLRTNVNRNDTHRFYEREGFKLIKTSHRYEFQVRSDGSA